jgi:hypothetical protein
MGPDHPDEAAGVALLMEAIGTTDPDFFLGFVSQLAKAGGGEIDEHQLNFLLAVVKGIKPRDQLEAMLAAQMAAVHTATMKFSRSLGGTYVQQAYANLCDTAKDATGRAASR